MFAESRLLNNVRCSGSVTSRTTEKMQILLLSRHFGVAPLSVKFSVKTEHENPS